MTIMFYFPLRHVYIGVWIIYSLYPQGAYCDFGKVYLMQHYLSAAYLIQSIVGSACNAEVLYSIVQSFVLTTGFVSYQLIGQQLSYRSVVQLVSL